jgi:hypothetical protein
MEMTQKHVGKMETQLKVWSVKLDELVAKAEEVGTEAKIDYCKRIDDLKAKHLAAQEKLVELRAAGIEEWESLKTGVEGTWKDVESAFKKLT